MVKNNSVVIENFIKTNEKEVYRSLDRVGKKLIKEYESVLTKVSTESDYLENNIESTENVLKNLIDSIASYSELSETKDKNMQFGFHEIRRNLDNIYRNLSFLYNKFMFEKNKKNIEDSKEQLSNLKKIITEAEEKIKVTEEKAKNFENSISDFEKKINNTKQNLDNLSSKIEGLGATFLNIVLTISIVSSMVAVLLNVKPEYAIMIVFACGWILLSSILFISEYYKCNESKKSFGIKVYIFFSFVTLLIVVLVPIFNRNKSVEEKTYFAEKESISQYISIEDKEVISSFLKNFSSYWKNNDETYINNLDIINIDYISKINFYKRTKGNLDYYDYEMLLVDNKTIVLKINSSDLKEWLYQNNLLIK